jgi:hypothetical protein
MATALPKNGETLNDHADAKPRMTKPIRFPRRTLIFAAAVLVLHTSSAYVLDTAGLIESLLSPNGERLLWILPMAVFFYALRIVALFVVPGLVVGNLILWLVDEVRGRRNRNPNK